MELCVSFLVNPDESLTSSVCGFEMGMMHNELNDVCETETERLQFD